MNQVQSSQAIAEVLLPGPFNHGFDYLLPPDHDVRIGDILKVPFGTRTLFGVVLQLKDHSTTVAQKLKLIKDKIPWMQLSTATLKFIEWMAGYTMAPRGAILKMTLSVPQAFEEEKRKKTVASLPPLNPDHTQMTFAADQLDAAIKLRRAAEAQQYQPFLLDGVTGSGKTEVYFEAIASALCQGKQCLILLPEISLTPQWLARFRNRFGAEPLVWNSDLTPAQRRKTWRSIAQGEARVVVGARSALFLPYPLLGLVVVDEEHETSYKQEEGVIYHARDMAVAKAAHLGIPLILVSATPSLETWVNAQSGKYALIKLYERHGTAQFPLVTAVDLRTSQGEVERAQWLSSSLKQAIAENLQSGEQTLLFLNRRGYAPLTLCRQCGYRLQCPNCTTWLIEHRSKKRLLCHHCGFSSALLGSCPECKTSQCFVACGPGVERIEEEVKAAFAQARVLVMASDAVESRTDLMTKIHQILNHEADIIIGTQIMAKGHHFPLLTLVGVIDADLGLSGGDLRACEKTYQLLHQVAGRCGRAHHPGKVILQTYHKDHPVMQALLTDQRDAFIEQELEMRRVTAMPPFARLAALIISGYDADKVEGFSKAFRQQAPITEGVEVLGPAVAPLAMIRRRHRWRILVKADKTLNLQTYLRNWLKRVGEVPSTIRLQIDIDPVSFL